VHFLSLTCSISPNIREGLLETFYGVYEKDPDKVIISTFKQKWPSLLLPYVNNIAVPMLGLCLLYHWKLLRWCRSFRQWFKWVFLCLLEIWLLSDEQHSSSLTGALSVENNSESWVENSHGFHFLSFFLF